MPRGVKAFSYNKKRTSIHSVLGTKNGRREQITTTQSLATAKSAAKRARENEYTDVKIVSTA